MLNPMESLFYKPFNLEIQRTWPQAIAMYVLYLILIVIFLIFVSGIVILLGVPLTTGLSQLIGQGVGLIISMSLTTLIINEKKSFSNYLYLSLIGLSGILALVGQSAILGLLPAVYLLTRPSLSFGGDQSVVKSTEKTKDSTADSKQSHTKKKNSTTSES